MHRLLPLLLTGCMFFHDEPSGSAGGADTSNVGGAGPGSVGGNAGAPAGGSGADDPGTLLEALDGRLCTASSDANPCVAAVVAGAAGPVVAAAASVGNLDRARFIAGWHVFDESGMPVHSIPPAQGQPHGANRFMDLGPGDQICVSGKELEQVLRCGGDECSWVGDSTLQGWGGCAWSEQAPDSLYGLRKTAAAWQLVEIGSKAAVFLFDGEADTQLLAGKFSDLQLVWAVRSSASASLFGFDGDVFSLELVVPSYVSGLSTADGSEYFYRGSDEDVPAPKAIASTWAELENGSLVEKDGFGRVVQLGQHVFADAVASSAMEETLHDCPLDLSACSRIIDPILEPGLPDSMSASDVIAGLAAAGSYVYYTRQVNVGTSEFTTLVRYEP